MAGPGETSDAARHESPAHAFDDWLRRSCRDPRVVSPSSFLFRSTAHRIDRQAGLEIIWMLSNPEWKQRATEHLSIPRIDTLETEVMFDLDLSGVGRHGIRPDAGGRIWAPVLVSPATVPSVLDVVGSQGSALPRLPSTEVRWRLAAALGHLLVRSAGSNWQEEHRSRLRDVELLLTCGIRYGIAASTSSGTGDLPRPATDRATDLDAKSEERTERRIRQAEEAVATMTFSPTVLGLFELCCGVRILAVGCHRDEVMVRCAMPSRSLTISLPPEARGVRRGRSAEAWRRRVHRLVRTGPPAGRVLLGVDTTAAHVAENYHVVLTLPEGVQAARPYSRVTTTIDFGSSADLLSKDIGDARSALAPLRARGGEGPPRPRWHYPVLPTLIACRDLNQALRALVAAPNSPWPSLLRERAAELRPLLAELEEWVAGDTGPVPPAPTGPLRPLAEVVGDLEVVLDDLEGQVEATPLVVDRAHEPREEAHPDRVHIAVPGDDPAAGQGRRVAATLQTGIFLSDPQTHAETDLASMANAVMVAAVSLGLGVASWLLRGIVSPGAEDALVTVLVLFAGVQISRLTRPSRTQLAGWLARTGYRIAFFSSLPCIALAVWVACGGLSDRLLSRTPFIVAAVLQLVIWWFGRRALEHGGLWEGGGEGDGEGQVRGGLWTIPSLRTEGPSPTLPRVSPILSHPETRHLCGAALNRLPETKDWRMVTVCMEDSAGNLHRFLEWMQPSSGEGAIALAGLIGTSFGGYAVVQAVISTEGDPGRLDRVREAMVADQAVHGRVWHLDPSPEVLPVEYTTVALEATFYEIFLHVRRENLEASLALLGGRAAANDLGISLFHSPANPPGSIEGERRPSSREQDRDRQIWVRARLSVPSGQSRDLHALLVDLRQAMAPGEVLRIRSVAEFDRPRGPDLLSHEHATAVPDPSRHVQGRMYVVTVEAPRRHGLLQKVMAGVRSLPPGLALQMATGGVVFGRAVATLYLADQGYQGEEDGVSAHLSAIVDVASSPTGSGHVRCHRLETWPRPELLVGREAVPAVRLTWRTPDTHGVVKVLVDCLRHTPGAAPNLLYVLARVTEGSTSVGRLVFRLESLDARRPLQRTLVDMVNRSETALAQLSAGVARDARVSESYVTADLFKE